MAVDAIIAALKIVYAASVDNNSPKSRFPHYLDQCDLLAQLYACCSSASSLTPSQIGTIVELPIQSLMSGRALPTVIVDGWISFAHKMLPLAVASAAGSIDHVLYDLGRSITASIKTLTKSTDATSSLCLDGLLKFACVLLQHVPLIVGDNMSLLPQDLPHPVRCAAQAARVSAFAFVPVYLKAKSMRGVDSSSPSGSANRNLGSSGEPPLLPIEWHMYLGKGVHSKEFAIREAAVQALADCLSAPFTLPDALVLLTVDWLSVVLGDVYMSPKLAVNISRALSDLLAATELYSVTSSSSSAAVVAPPFKPQSSSSWSLWGGNNSGSSTPSSSSSSSSLEGATWPKLLSPFLRPPMTKVTQGMLGDAIGFFLLKCCQRRPDWLLDGAAKVLPMVLPAPSDTHAYAPKIVTRALRLWSDGLDSDSLRYTLIASLLPFASTNSPKPLLQTVVASVHGIMSTLGYIKSDVATMVISTMKPIVDGLGPSSSNAAEVCALVAKLDASVYLTCMSRYCDACEDVRNDEHLQPLPTTLTAAARIVCSMAPSLLQVNLGSNREVFMSHFISLSVVPARQHAAGNEADEDITTSAERDAVARRWELAHQIVQTLMHADASTWAKPCGCVSVVLTTCTLHSQWLAKQLLSAEGAPSSFALLLRVTHSVVSTARTLFRLQQQQDDSTHLADTNSNPTSIMHNSTSSSALIKAVFDLAKKVFTNNNNNVGGVGRGGGSVALANLIVKLHTELLLFTSSYQSSSPSFDAASNKRFRFLVSVAIREVSQGTLNRVPLPRDDARIYPPSVALFMSTCRRTTVASHQLPQAAAMEAAVESLATCFSRRSSSPQDRSNIIALLFDMLSLPNVDPVTAQWNVICCLERVLQKDAEGDACSREQARAAWKQMHVVARTLRNELLSTFIPSATLDVQCVAAKAFAHLSLLVDDHITDVTKIAIEVPRDSNARCGTLLLLGERFADPEAPVNCLPLVTSHIAEALKTVELFGDPCTAMAIAAMTCILRLADLHPDTIARDVWWPHLLPLLMRPSTQSMDSLVLSLLRALVGSIMDVSHHTQLRAVSMMVMKSWCSAVQTGQEPHTLLGSVSVFHRCCARTIACGGPEFGVTLADTFLALPKLSHLVLHSSAFIPALLQQLQQLVAIPSLSITQIARLVDASRCCDERQTWQRIAVHMAHESTPAKWTSLLAEAVQIANAKQQVVNAHDTNTTNANPQLQQPQSRHSKSEEYGEDVSEEQEQQQQRGGSGNNKSRAPSSGTAADAARLFPLVPCDFGSKKCVTECVTEILRAHPVDTIRSHLSLDELVRFTGIVSSLSESNHTMIKAATDLTSMVLRVFFSASDGLLSPSTATPLILPAAYRLQISSAVRQLSRVVTCDGTHNAIEAAHVLCTLFSRSTLADDTSLGRVVQAVVGRIRALEEHMSEPQYSADALALIFTVSSILGVASSKNWKNCIDLIRESMTAQDVQQAMNKVGLYLMQEIYGRRGALWYSPDVPYFVVDVPVQPSEALRLYLRLVTVLWPYTTTSATPLDNNVGHHSIGPSLRNTLGALTASALPDMLRCDDTTMCIIDLDTIELIVRVSSVVQRHQQEKVACTLLRWCARVCRRRIKEEDIRDERILHVPSLLVFCALVLEAVGPKNLSDDNAPALNALVKVVAGSLLTTTGTFSTAPIRWSLLAVVALLHSPSRVEGSCWSLEDLEQAFQLLPPQHFTSACRIILFSKNADSDDATTTTQPLFIALSRAATLQTRLMSAIRVLVHHMTNVQKEVSISACEALRCCDGDAVHIFFFAACTFHRDKNACRLLKNLFTTDVATRALSWAMTSNTIHSVEELANIGFWSASVLSEAATQSHEQGAGDASMMKEVGKLLFSAAQTHDVLRQTISALPPSIREALRQIISNAMSAAPPAPQQMSVAPPGGHIATSTPPLSHVHVSAAASAAPMKKKLSINISSFS